MQSDTQYTAPTFHQIMRQVLQWVEPHKKIPLPNDPKIILFTWNDMATEVIIPHRREPSRPIEARKRGNLEDSANMFLRDVWNYVSTYSREFLVDDFRPYLTNMLPTPLTTDPASPAAYDYMRRFTTPQWNWVLHYHFRVLWAYFL
ncbi:hypothetical protein BDW59DRAFT_153098 [Aspergillus cavernicola]|uniref:Uncharacterized protein n=1 Tax=Aspergillus cavernicola TaxID=176166 RepID=A0ABR4HN45_9EURO